MLPTKELFVYVYVLVHDLILRQSHPRGGGDAHLNDHSAHPAWAASRVHSTLGIGDPDALCLTASITFRHQWSSRPMRA